MQRTFEAGSGRKFVAVEDGPTLCFAISALVKHKVEDNASAKEGQGRRGFTVRWSCGNIDNGLSSFVVELEGCTRF